VAFVGHAKEARRSLTGLVAVKMRMVAGRRLGNEGGVSVESVRWGTKTINSSRFDHQNEEAVL